VIFNGQATILQFKAPKASQLCGAGEYHNGSISLVGLVKVNKPQTCSTEGFMIRFWLQPISATVVGNDGTFEGAGNATVDSTCL
jgi:hypothetical protein